MFGKIKITDFSKRHFDPKFGGTKITDIDIEKFERILNDIVSDVDKNLDVPCEFKIIDGYADFCKLISIGNFFTNAKVGSLPIDVANYQYLRSGYSSRTEKELPVLSRWFELPLSAPVANYLVIVVYSREQLKKEFDAKSLDDPFDEKFELGHDVDWGVVGILGQSHPDEEPMQPITMMRNALGLEEGGSGVPLNKQRYQASVDFWSKNAIVKS